MGLISLKYRRPKHVNKEEFLRSYTSISENETGNPSLKSGHSGPPSGVPDALTFDRIINGGTCPPCTIRDFMNYLIYIEHAAENLQFFLWYRDYVKRFNEINISEAQLSPEWTQTMEDEATAKIQKNAVDKMRKEPKVAVIFKGTDFEKGASDTVVEIKDPFSTPPPTPSLNDTTSIFSGSQLSSHQVQAQDAFNAAGATQPFTIQPFRAELDRVISTYLADSAPRQLNLSSREQKAAIQALSRTTHPSALRSVARGVEATLRRQAHPNFVRWSICNGNPARVTFARGLGVGVIACATLGALLLTLSGAARGWRALFAVGWVLGIATLVAAAKGMCVVLHGLHHRHVRPWELFEDPCSSSSSSPTSFDESELEEQGKRGKGKNSFDSFGSSNSYEDEPWVVRYERRGVVRRVFDREVWIREPALRQVQDVIFAQSLLAAVLGAAVLTAVFVSVPAGGFF
ncbi:uncharacterized protein F4807DRAFT_450223 [Annulohypoxylon truncatum]|uniref:uncharacterized protein n=1 Tax=Annulohypoxylon truncatum TaxID=327061 RepID=UPI00200787B1|nr:uncharacterized protein F4807DRAFT_450223 [Annulohypoxylon truncatum]KAI1212541.1 hypothetical protein F4807DRAFT_450223 [Annulohypoxylon truncatum]